MAPVTSPATSLARSSRISGGHVAGGLTQRQPAPDRHRDPQHGQHEQRPHHRTALDEVCTEDRCTRYLLARDVRGGVDNPLIGRYEGSVLFAQTTRLSTRSCCGRPGQGRRFRPAEQKFAATVRRRVG